MALQAGGRRFDPGTLHCYCRHEKKAPGSRRDLGAFSVCQAPMPAFVLTPIAVPSRISPIIDSLSSTLSAMFSATHEEAAAFAASASSADSHALNEMKERPRRSSAVVWQSSGACQA